MSHDSQSTAEAASLGSGSVTQSFVSGSHRIYDAVLGVLAVLYEFFTFIISKAVHLSVIFGTTLHSRVLVPFSVFALATAGISYELWQRFVFAFRSFRHKVSVAAVGFRSNRFALAATVLSLTFVLIASTLYGVGIKITVNGEELGYMYSRDEYTEAVSFVEQRASEILERPYSISSNVRFELGIVPREEIISKDALRSYFFSHIEEVSMLYALTVNGEVIGASKNRDTLQSMVDELLYTNDPNVKAHFSQDVQISQKYVDSSKLLSYDEIREKLTSKIHSTREYTIKYGDTVESIAAANGMTKADLIELNPSIRSGRLRAGRKLTVAKEVPFLSVEAVRRVEYTESIPFETKTVEDSTIYKGTQKVVTNGRVGTRKVVADVTYVDNKETGREIISSAVVAQPVTKVVHVGTKARPKTVATGKLSRPVRGAIISSNYGMRRGSMHKGVDFAAKSGTRISAADGGTVTWAGWKRGGWGYLVVINHGNGIETYYAHNSKVLVRVGQKVAKGEQIAKMGSTGNSSGPHCHFEVHVNGRYTNPWKYIS
ncbi:MAG: M23 family metallopeptidase [Oscillospiraceae bacterium]|nr:M23 family metallopeptidase [Oscillospiraceae bacterium]